MSKDELLSHFCETPSIWSERQKTPCSSFAKGLRFRNMVMTFVLTPLSHYKSITEPRARFLLSLLEDLTINFPSHFIISFIDVYQDMATRDKLNFPSAITRILHHFFYPYSWFSLLHHYRCHQHSFCSVEQGPASIEAATDKVNWSCSFCYSFHLRSFFLGWPCDRRGYHGTALGHGCLP